MREIRVKIRLQNLLMVIALLCMTALIGCTSQKQASTATSQPSNAPAVSKSTEAQQEVARSEQIENIHLVETDDIKPSEITINTNNIADRVNSANFKKIKEGMSYEEVARVFGDEGMKVSIMKINDRKILTYKWTTADFKKYIDVTFENNKVVKKANKGL